MASASELILTAIIAVLVVLLIAYQLYPSSWPQVALYKRSGFNAGGASGAQGAPAAGPFGGRVRAAVNRYRQKIGEGDYTGSAYDPYTVLNAEIDTIRGQPHGGFNQPPFWRQPHGLDRFHRAGAFLRPEQVAEAEREEWYAAARGDSVEGFNPERADSTGDMMQSHATQPSIDYGTYISDLVVDPRTRDNHQRWVEEMKPWAGTAKMVDDLNEAMEATTDFTGLRRPQAIAQYNPQQLTERDTYTFSGNSKFNFKG